MSTTAIEAMAVAGTNHWRSLPLGEVVDILDRLRRPITKRSRVAGPYPYYGATGVLDWVDGYLFDEQLILVGEDGAKWGPGDDSAFAISGKTWVNNHAHVLRPMRDHVLDDWLLYFVNATDLTEFISGMTVPKLNQGRLREIPIPLPPLKEQKRIVAILDQAFAALDRARAHAEANLADAAELFERWLTAVFHDHSTSWKTEKLKQLCHKITVGHVGPMSKRYVDGGIPFLRSQNIRPFEVSLDAVKYIDDEFHRELGKSALFPGDVAIVRTGYPGTAAEVPENLSVANCADLVIIRPKDGIVAAFLVMFFNSSFGKDLVASKAVGAAQKHFNIGAAKEVCFPFPTVEEQKRLVAQSNVVRSRTCDLTRCFEKQLTNIADLRQSLLQKAFAGELN